MHGPAASHQASLPRLTHRRSVLGIRLGQFACWQIIAVAAAVAAAERGPVSWALTGLALTGCCLTMLRWRHRWGYEWLVTAWTYRQVRTRNGTAAAGPAQADPDWMSAVPPGSAGTLPPIDVCPTRLRSGAEAGVAHDGNGFSLIIAVAARPAGPPVIDLPVAALTGLLDPQDAMVSAVQLVLHDELAAHDATSIPATAYRNLGYNQVPRSQSIWLALRHDPALSWYAIGSPGSSRDVRTSLLRALAGRSARALDTLASVSLKAQVLDVAAARDLLTKTLIEAEPAGGSEQAAGPARAHSWDAWHSSGRQHVTYWLRRWPADGMRALQQALATVPARSVTTAVLVTAAGAGRFGLTVTVRVTTAVGVDQVAVRRAVSAAAASCGARLTRMDGEHVGGVLATLPLGQPPVGRSLSWRTGGTHESVPGTVLPITAGGVVLGPQVGGEDDKSAVAVPFFTAEGTIRATVVGDPLLHRLLGLRALGAGARLHVVTTQPGAWLRLRDHARQADRMTIARPGTRPPPDGTRADPWMIIDDTGSPAIAGSGPWLAVVTALGEPGEPGAILPGQDAIMVQRSSREVAASVAASLALPPYLAQSLAAAPDGLVAVARRGAIRFARLAPDQAERSILARSMQPD